MDSSPSSADGLDLTLDERLAAVKAAGLRRRVRRHRFRAGLAGLAAVTLVAGVAILPSDEGTPVHTEAAGEGPSTTGRTEVLGTVIERDPADVTTTTVGDETATTPPAPVATEPGTPSQPAVTTTRPAGPCQTGPECGPFHWVPGAPADQALVLTHDPVGPATVGLPVTITVRWSDGDAQLTFIDDDTDDALLAEACREEPRYGPWALPAPAPGSGSVAIEYTPVAAGIQSVTVYAASGYCDGYDPYHSWAMHTIEIDVAPAP